MKVLSRDEFKEAFFNPLHDELGLNIYWNSKNLYDLGLKPTCLEGVTYTKRPGTPIILKYKKDNMTLLNTLIHECGHALMHSKYNNLSNNTYEKLSNNMHEVEAETVAKKVFHFLNIDYYDDKYINRYKEKCKISDFKYYKENKREDMIDALSYKIAMILSNSLDIILEMNDDRIKKTEYKYYLICPNCHEEYGFKRMCSAVRNYKSVYCTHCGTKTLGKMERKDA